MIACSICCNHCASGCLLFETCSIACCVHVIMNNSISSRAEDTRNVGMSVGSSIRFSGAAVICVGET